MIFRPRERDRASRVEHGSLDRHFTAALEGQLAPGRKPVKAKVRLDTDSIV
jgi:hypothetical protein